MFSIFRNRREEGREKMEAVYKLAVRKEVQALESIAEDRERAAEYLQRNGQYSSALKLKRDAERKHAEIDYLRSMELEGD